MRFERAVLNRFTRRSRLLCSLGALFMLLCACRTKEPAGVSRGSLEADVVEYVRLAAGLGARDSDSLDYAYPPAEWTAGEMAHLPTFAAVRERALAAADRV